MKNLVAVLSLIFTLAITGCQKSIPGTEDDGLATQNTGRSPIETARDPKSPSNENDKILVDASKDGGVWWFPQGPSSFSDSTDHQGKYLADYLRSLGYHVDELPRGAVITDELLSNYSKVIRGPAFYDYTDQELDAYKNFMNKPGAILLLQDHLSYTVNDKVSGFLGLSFRGAVSGTITNFADHDITKNVGPLPFIAGAVITNAENNPGITVLGSISKTDYISLNSADPFNGQTPDGDIPVMGIVTSFPGTKIFFIGDSNAIEGVPQPLTQNIVNWLFK